MAGNFRDQLLQLRQAQIEKARQEAEALEKKREAEREARQKQVKEKNAQSVAVKEAPKPKSVGEKNPIVELKL